ncbi:MAG TPA: response regulator transcription factor [Blastocatellia bacterium]|nr:response regulator transcription factor [Blastocatellia bacterium]
MSERVLIIDDDVELCELVAEFLSSEGFTVESIHDGEAGARQAVAGAYALVVLDVMLPGLNGFEVLRRIRQAGRVPVLMLTARGDDVDRIVGLELGADDYLPKPFNPRELVARIRAILRRTQAAPGETTAPPEKFTVGDVELDKGTRTVRRSGELIELTSVEFELLAVLLRNAGRVVIREELVRSVLGRELSPFDRSIDMHVSNLRKKLGHEVNGIERIRTVRGVGYIYVVSGQ